MNDSSLGGGVRVSSVVFAAVAGLALAGSAMAQYAPLNVVSDGFVPALHTDANLKNSWGIAFNPAGFVWVADNHSGKSTLYDGFGNANSLVVTVPPATAGPGAMGNPTGIVFSGSATDFQVDATGNTPARFIWASEDGSISAWNPNAPPPPPSTQAFRKADNSASGAIYKGLALSGSTLYATDFHNGRVDQFNSTFGATGAAGAFTDPTIPAGYAPFNVQKIGASLFVTYAKQDAKGEDDDHGPGRGYINEFDTAGNFVRRFASEGVLNSPWGLALAPADFGPLSGALLVGNFGDGRINAFNLATGAPIGAMLDSSLQPIEIEGLWGLSFGNGLLNQPTNTLFFTGGPSDEEHGVYGRIDVPAPGTAAWLVAAAALIGIRRRRA